MTYKRTLYLTIIFGLTMAQAIAQAPVEQCSTLQSSSPEELSQFLQAAIPHIDNPHCVAFALRTLGNQKYEPAVSTVAKFLDFRRPKSEEENNGLYIRPNSIDELYPAAHALVAMGAVSLPAVLAVIESGSSSQLARENAISVWMEIQRDDSPHAVATLVREAETKSDPIARQNLDWAATKALDWCNPPDKPQCKAARTNPKPRADAGVPQK
jgi:hypothetical protein